MTSIDKMLGISFKRSIACKCINKSDITLQYKQALHKRLLHQDTVVQELCKTKPFSEECILAIETLSDFNKKYHDISYNYEKDPLERFCEEVPDDEQCRVYDV